MVGDYWLNEAAAKQAEIDMLRADMSVMKAALRMFVAAYDKEYPLRSVDQHPTDCFCLQCARDAAEYLVNAVK